MSDCRERLVELDIIRVISIGLVVALHLTGYTYTLKSNVILDNVPTFGVALFLYISGYGLYLSNKKIDGVKGIVSFLKKRVTRIYPLYFFALIIYFIVFDIFVIMMKIHLTLHDWFVYIFGLQFILKTDISYVPVLWFIGVIIFFYILYVIIQYFAKNFFETVLYAGISYILLQQVIAMGYCTLLSGSGDIRLPLFYIAFFAGVISGYYNIFQYSKYYTNKIPSRIIGIITYCSIASYAVYLLHRPFFAISHTFISSIGLTYFSLTYAEIDLIMICISVPILVIICYYLQKMYDFIINNKGINTPFFDRFIKG